MTRRSLFLTGLGLIFGTSGEAIAANDTFSALAENFPNGIVVAPTLSGKGVGSVTLPFPESQS